jgi:hypothetical protein
VAESASMGLPSHRDILVTATGGRGVAAPGAALLDPMNPDASIRAAKAVAVDLRHIAARPSFSSPTARFR